MAVELKREHNDSAAIASTESGDLVLKTDILIVGAGPAGASLACFLALHGLTGIIISRSSSTADTPRAHVTNAAALGLFHCPLPALIGLSTGYIECLRDIGLEDECIRNGTPGHYSQHQRWCYSVAGEEYIRKYAWGNDPRRVGDYDEASPCKHMDLPQSVLEPILMKYATQNGFKARFNTKFVTFKSNEKTGMITTVVEDSIAGQLIRFESKYLFGADGARSEVAKQLQLPLKTGSAEGVALNVWFDADLTHLLETRRGLLHCILQPDREDNEMLLVAVLRMVRPWHEWLLYCFPPPGAGADWRPSDEIILDRVKQFIGDRSIPIKIKGVSKWTINEVVAENYSEGNIFCLGDAVHRHSPANGLGSNTCIQDAYNLAWKVAYVMKGHAGRALLDTYTAERQPIGQGVVSRASEYFKDQVPIWGSLGILEPSLTRRKEILAELSDDSSQGAVRRRTFYDAVEGGVREWEGLGIEMNQRYASTGIVLEDEETGYPSFEKDPILYHQRTTYPGSRLPHVWLNTTVPSKAPISIHDLAGHGFFTIFTGFGGTNGWKRATEAIAEDFSVPMRLYSIGWRQDYQDVYLEWEKVRGVGESGCVLVRPDRTVAWRCQAIIDNSTEKLRHVMRSLLSL